MESKNIYIRLDGGGFAPYFTFTLVVNEQEFNLGHYMDSDNVRKEMRKKAALILKENNIIAEDLDFKDGEILL